MAKLKKIDREENVRKISKWKNQKNSEREEKVRKISKWQNEVKFQTRFLVSIYHYYKELRTFLIVSSLGFTNISRRLSLIVLGNETGVEQLLW